MTRNHKNKVIWWICFLTFVISIPLVGGLMWAEYHSCGDIKITSAIIAPMTLIDLFAVFYAGSIKFDR